MIKIQDNVVQSFRFLEAECGFRLCRSEENLVRYENGTIYIETDYHSRDGAEVSFGRLCEPKERFYVGTILGAILTRLGQYKEAELGDVSDPNAIEREIRTKAEFLRLIGSPIFFGDPCLFQKLSKLGFWHVGKWVHLWGSTIVMTPAELNEAKALVSEIMRILDNGESNRTISAARAAIGAAS